MKLIKKEAILSVSLKKEGIDWGIYYEPKNICFLGFILKRKGYYSLISGNRIYDPTRSWRKIIENQVYEKASVSIEYGRDIYRKHFETNEEAQDYIDDIREQLNILDIPFLLLD